MPLTIGDSLPALMVKATSGKNFDLSSLRGKNVLIYFYPKDATPGCTTEAQDFRDLMPEFARLNCEILGVSRDSMNSHEKFKANECLPFELLSDVDESLCQAFDVIKMKNMYGKQVQGFLNGVPVFCREQYSAAALAGNHNGLMGLSCFINKSVQIRARFAGGKGVHGVPL